MIALPRLLVSAEPLNVILITATQDEYDSARASMSRPDVRILDRCTDLRGIVEQTRVADTAVLATENSDDPAVSAQIALVRSSGIRIMRSRPPGMAARNASIVRKRRGGARLDEIAQEYGLTRERVRQIVLATDASANEEGARARKQRKQDALVEKARSTYFHTYQEAQMAAREAEVNIRDITSDKDLRRLRQQRVLRLVRGDGHEWLNRRDYEDEQILEALRKARLDLGVERMSAGAYTRWAKHHDAPSVPLMAKRFGSWSRALAAAGLPANEAPSYERFGAQSRRYDESDFYLQAARFFAQHGLEASHDAMSRWTPGHPGPSSSYLRDYFLTYGEVRLAGLAVLCARDGEFTVDGEVYHCDDVPWSEFENAQKHLEAARAALAEEPRDHEPAH